ncbi:hypothetical protein HMPREF1545_00147 [Oscillibacter sp. KLE 1728]|nr:hypothetical protein HMPREF1546_02305 [Oscillibacter sp. KLE 1745]ERK65008.1 hypothetical protein HMPREF1545_00147 [Oscillibacter sp. KLE 1728]
MIICIVLHFSNRQKIKQSHNLASLFVNSFFFLYLLSHCKHIVSENVKTIKDRNHAWRMSKNVWENRIFLLNSIRLLFYLSDRENIVIKVIFPNVTKLMV